MLQPLNVRLWITVHLTHELHVAAQGYSLVGRQPCLKDGSVRRSFCGGIDRTGVSDSSLASGETYTLTYSNLPTAKLLTFEPDLREEVPFSLVLHSHFQTQPSLLSK